MTERDNHQALVPVASTELTAGAQDSIDTAGLGFISDVTIECEQDFYKWEYAIAVLFKADGARHRRTFYLAQDRLEMMRCTNPAELILKSLHQKISDHNASVSARS